MVALRSTVLIKLRYCETLKRIGPTLNLDLVNQLDVTTGSSQVDSWADLYGSVITVVPGGDGNVCAARLSISQWQTPSCAACAQMEVSLLTAHSGIKKNTRKRHASSRRSNVQDFKKLQTSDVAESDQRLS